MSVSTGTNASSSEGKRVGQRSFMDWLGSFGSEDIGVDFGTTNIVVYVKNKGLVLPESSAVAVRAPGDEIFAWGTKAEAMDGRCPQGARVIHPLKESAIVDYGSAYFLLNAVVNQSYLKGMFFHPRLMMCVPGSITAVQRRALLEASVAMGARKTVLIEQPIASAMGIGLGSSGMEGVFIVDIGGGTTKIAALSRNGILSSDFLTESGSVMDRAIVLQVREKYHVLIGNKAAERLKNTLGVYWDVDKGKNGLEVCGMSLSESLPTKIYITAEDVAEALNPIIYRIFERIRIVLQRTPPTMLADIRDYGIMLVGGAAQLKGLDILTTRVTGIPSYVVENPSFVNAIGAGLSLEYMDYFRDSLQDLH